MCVSTPTLQPMVAESCALAEIGPCCFGNAGEGLGGSRMTLDVKNRESEERGAGPRTDADICCGIPEFRPWFVFGTQLSAIWNPAILPLHFSLGSFLFRGPPCSRLYLSVVVPLRHSTPSFYHFPKNTILVSYSLQQY